MPWRRRVRESTQVAQPPKLPNSAAACGQLSFSWCPVYLGDMARSGLQKLRDLMRSGRAFALVSLLLTAFALQIAVTRAHFHVGAAFGIAKAAQTDGAPAKLPLGHDEPQCLLWQASVTCGNAIAAAAADLSAVTPVPARAVLKHHVEFIKRFAVTWRSRAPPAI
jgi:hypothetical protein